MDICFKIQQKNELVDVRCCCCCCSRLTFFLFFEQKKMFSSSSSFFVFYDRKIIINNTVMDLLSIYNPTPSIDHRRHFDLVVVMSQI